MFGRMPPEVLRNTARLEAWRAYNRKAYGPMIALTPVGAIVFSAALPAEIALMRYHHWMWSFAVTGVAFAIYFALIAWIVLRAVAYRRAHPFELPN